MRYKREENTTATLQATLDDDTRIQFKAEINKIKEFYPVNEVDEKVNIMGMFKALSEICKSSSDIDILGSMIDGANALNEIVIPSITEFAEDMKVSRKHLNTLLNRAEEAKLLHKLGTGRYFLNPYKILGKTASGLDYQRQELIQVRWKEETGLFTELELEKLVNLSNYLELDVCLRPTQFNRSVAEHYSSKHQITDKQKKSVLKGIK